MIKEEIEILSGQAHQFTLAFKSDLKDPTDIDVFTGFVSQYYSVTAQPLLVTRDQLISVQNEIHSRDILVNYVFGLRFFALSPFTRKELSQIIDSFANASANRPTQSEIQDLSVVPNDAQMWTVKFNEILSLYEANTWIIPLMSLGFVYPSFTELGEQG